MPKPAGPRQPRTSRLELERLLDRTVLGPTHPELGTCWQFTGTTTPYGRIGSSSAAQYQRAWISPNGARVCKACNAAAQRAFRERQRARGSPGDNPP